jgi:phosphate starvation-inducible protein PhoH
MSIHKHRRPNKKKPKHKTAKQILGPCNLKDVAPLTDTQEQTFISFNQEQNLLLHGVAGTGKSYISLYLALRDLLEDQIDKILIVRSVVPSRDVGFLPGTVNEKIVVYEQPYREMVGDLLQRGDSYDIMKKSGQIQFITSSFVRGLTFDNCIIVIDEIQNFTDQEINSILTRMGKNSRVIICGDYRQDDLKNSRRRETSGFENLLKIAKRMKSFDIIEYKIDDIVRSGFVKEYLIARTYANIDE